MLELLKPPLYFLGPPRELGPPSSAVAVANAFCRRLRRRRRRPSPLCARRRWDNALAMDEKEEEKEEFGQWLIVPFLLHGAD